MQKRKCCSDYNMSCQDNGKDEGLWEGLRLFQLQAGWHILIFLECIMLNMAIEEDQGGSHSKQSLLFSQEENLSQCHIQSMLLIQDTSVRQHH